MTFTFKELKNVTKNFFHQIGKGAFGSVFKGTLSDDTLVTKKNRGFCIVQKIIPCRNKLYSGKHTSCESGEALGILRRGVSKNFLFMTTCRMGLLTLLCPACLNWQKECWTGKPDLVSL